MLELIGHDCAGKHAVQSNPGELVAAGTTFARSEFAACLGRVQAPNPKGTVLIVHHYLLFVERVTFCVLGCWQNRQFRTFLNAE